MAARQSLSREPSLAESSIRSRRSSTASNPNVFSDDYALDFPHSGIDSNLEPYFDSPEASSSHRSPPRESIIIAPYPRVPHSHSAALPPSKRPLLADDAATMSESGLDRSHSTSTRFSFPRSQSPYTGPTAPSHPYSMYPQATRASSIASDSTLRPHPETPFVPRGGPEHPYAMYPQNTVPEEDEDITTGGIPLGFSRTGNFASSSGGSNSDVGDIIGSDGHVEQLPPYTRYADNTVAKGNMEDFHGPQMTEIRRSPSREPLQPPSEPTLEEQPSSQPSEPFDVEPGAARKEGWKKKAQKRVCGGMPLWSLFLIFIIVILAATLGGVIGGVVGNQQGAERALATFSPTTVWLDAQPTTTGSNMPTLPTGNYTIPLHQSNEVHSCISSQDYFAWGCLDLAYIGITVQQPDPSGPMQAIFQDFSVDQSSWIYGPQPPDFNGSSFDLKPFVDNNQTDRNELGVAMFFSAIFDKLVIVPENDITPSSKRSISRREVERRGSTDKLMVGQHPWFCFWNSTVNEFWIYLSQAQPTSTMPPPSSAAVTTGYAALSAPPMTTSGVQKQALNWLYDTPTTTFAANLPTPPHFHPRPPQPDATWHHHDKRGSYTTKLPSTPADYPRLIKMIEKRKPDGNIQPYCQKMEVQADSIIPLTGTPLVYIVEVQYEDQDEGPAGSKKLRRDTDSMNELESSCICEWMSYKTPQDS